MSEVSVVLSAYDVAASIPRDVEAGMKPDDVTVDDVTVTTSSASAAGWAGDTFSEKNIRLAFIRKVSALQ